VRKYQNDATIAAMNISTAASGRARQSDPGAWATGCATSYATSAQARQRMPLLAGSFCSFGLLVCMRPV
jgi:hypothetical protein